MNLPAHKRPGILRRAGLLGARLLVAACTAGMGTGCESSYSAVGKSQIWAEYSFGSLAADLPAGVRVPAVVSAADASLRRRGYSVTTSNATAVEGSVHAKAPASAGDVSVSARVTDAGTRVKVKVGLLGDEAISRSVLEDTMRQLGL